MATKAEKTAKLEEEKKIGDENEANGLNRDGTPKSPLGDGDKGAENLAGGKEEKGGKKKTVEIDVDVLEKILAKQEAQDELNKKQAKEIEILREVADKGRLNKADQARADGKLQKMVRLAKIGDLYVVGWKRIKDEVYTDERGVIHEDQQVEYFFDDKTSKIFTDVYFSRNRRQEQCEVIAEKKDREGRISYDVMTPKGQELSIDVIFVN